MKCGRHNWSGNLYIHFQFLHDNQALEEGYYLWSPPIPASGIVVSIRLFSGKQKVTAKNYLRESR